jgi:hypothetical protein
MYHVIFLLLPKTDIYDLHWWLRKGGGSCHGSAFGRKEIQCKQQNCGQGTDKHVVIAHKQRPTAQ